MQIIADAADTKQDLETSHDGLPPRAVLPEANDDSLAEATNGDDGKLSFDLSDETLRDAVNLWTDSVRIIPMPVRAFLPCHLTISVPTDTIIKAVLSVGS